MLAEPFKQAGELLAQYAVPLYKADRYKGTVQVGTGFIVKVSGCAFLVTAAHVLDLGDDPESRLFYFVNDIVIRDVDGMVMRTAAPQGRDADKIDVGVVLLQDNYRHPLKKIAVDVHSLFPRMTPRSGHSYIVVGFPETKNRAHRVHKHIPESGYGYHTHSEDASIYGAAGVSEESHILLSFERELGKGNDGHPMIFPDPHGMSGAPIWLVPEDGDNETKWKYGFPIVGIATRHLKRTKQILGTDISVATTFIGDLLTLRPTLTRSPAAPFQRRPLCSLFG
ncbi:hypothetical protein [Variovorax sp. tm]|uniref:hypothetical protein n=1 Tax=Variovorax atrisoli TaxID=3394203 RepID=UPI003A7F8AD4